MAVNNDNVIAWFKNRVGKLTYSMTGSRNGADGTADCSGSITQAVRDAGGSAYSRLYSTVDLSTYLAANGYKCISRNQDFDSKKGDIILMSWSADMAGSGGAGGHVGVMSTETDFISTTYYVPLSGNVWVGAGGAVREANWNQYYNWSRPTYIEVWRNTNSGGNPKPPTPSKPSGKTKDQIAIEKLKAMGGGFTLVKPFKISEIKTMNGIAMYVNYDLAGWGDVPSAQWKANGNSKGTAQNWIDAGIPFEATFKPGYKFKVGDMINPEITGTIDEYDIPSGSVGVNLSGWDGRDFGMVWFKADALLNRF